MSILEAEQVMKSIESLNARFDPDKARHYMALVREFVLRARRYLESQGLPLTTPFIDPTEPLRVTLPKPLDRRLQDWETGPSSPNPYVRQACRSYIKYIAVREELPPDQSDVDVYAPLIQLLMEGGSFYMHHGEICIPDVGSLPLITP